MGRVPRYPAISFTSDPASTRADSAVSPEMPENAVRPVGIVRFDAFEDMGGRLSFSAAFLDGQGNGVVITSISGRQDTRCYAKQIRHGGSAHHLSDEERQAIRDALAGPAR